MPFKQKRNGSIEFIRLPADKCVYGVEKGEEGKRYLYLRRFDTSGLKLDSVKGFAGSLIEVLNDSSSEDDWIVPIKCANHINIGKLGQHSGPNVARLLAMDPSSRPWFSVVHTPNDVIYFTKRRLSASTTLQAVGLAASLLNPVSAVGAIGWFARKQHAKYNMAKGRGEQDPSIMPKVFVHKIWQVSVSGDLSEAYANIARIIESGNAWTEW